MINYLQKSDFKDFCLSTTTEHKATRIIPQNNPLLQSDFHKKIHKFIHGFLAVGGDILELLSHQKKDGNALTNYPENGTILSENSGAEGAVLVILGGRNT
jgi:hypothetical protein